MRCSCWQWPLVSFTLLSFAHHLTLPLLATDMTPNLRSGLSHAIVLCYQACDFWLFKGYPACSYIINHNTGCPNKFRMESVSRKSQSCASFFLSFFCQKNKPTNFGFSKKILKMKYLKSTWATLIKIDPIFIHVYLRNFGR